MKPELRQKIINNNKAANKLKNAGYSLLGLIKDMTQIAVSKNNEIFYFKDYIEVSEKLLNN